MTEFNLGKKNITFFDLPSNYSADNFNIIYLFYINILNQKIIIISMKEKEKSEEEPFRVVTSRRKKKSNHKVTSSVILNSESNQDIDQDAVLE